MRRRTARAYREDKSITTVNVDVTGVTPEVHWTNGDVTKAVEVGDGVAYFGKRFYNPLIGTFLSTGKRMQYWSSYSLGPGDPVNGINPNGNKWCPTQGAVIGASALTNSTVIPILVDAQEFLTIGAGPPTPGSNAELRSLVVNVISASEVLTTSFVSGYPLVAVGTFLYSEIDLQDIALLRASLLKLADACLGHEIAEQWMGLNLPGGYIRYNFKDAHKFALGYEARIYGSERVWSSRMDWTNETWDWFGYANGDEYSMHHFLGGAGMPGTGGLGEFNKVR